ncbi:translocation/assembly module TamB domain-containing protein, partial [Negativicoccus succinicivorans]
LPEVVAGIGDGRVRGSGYYNFATNTGAGEYAAENINLAQLPETDGAYAGTINGRGAVELHDGEMALATFTGSGTGVSGAGIKTDSLRTSLRYEAGALAVHYLNGTMGDGTFTAFGNTDTPQGIQVAAHHLPLSYLSGLAGVTMSGAADLTGQLTGSVSAPQFVGTVSARDGAIHGLSYTSIHGDVAYVDDTFTTNRLVWQDAEGGHVVSGNAQLGGAKALDLTVQSDNIRLESLLHAADLPLDATGWATNSLTVHGTVDQPEASGELHLWDGSVLGELYQDVVVRYRYNGDILYLDEALASMYNGTLHASGTIAPNALNVQLQASEIDIDRVLREKNTYGLAGTVSAEGVLRGTPADLRLEADFWGHNLYANGEPIDGLRGHLAYGEGVVGLTDTTLTQRDGVYRLNGTYCLDGGVFRGAGDVDGADIARLLSLANIPHGNLAGQVTGHVELKGTAANPSLRINGKLENGSIDGKPFGTTEIDADYANRVATIRKLHMPIGAGVLAAAGTADLDGEIDMQVAAKDVDVTYVTALAGQPLDLTGNLNVSAVFTGPTKTPVMDMSFELSNGAFAGVTFDRFIGLLNMRDQIIEVNQTLLQREPYQLSMYGKVPVAALTKAGRATQSNESMNLEIRLDKADLELLRALSPAVLSATGETKGGITVTGTLADPHINGRIFVADGAATIETMKSPLEHIQAELKCNGKSATWRGQTTIGGGDLTTAGEVRWTDFTDMRYEGTLDADAINPQSSYYSGPLTAHLQLAQQAGMP